MSAADYIRILPELGLPIFGMMVMVIDPLLPEHNDRKGVGVLALVGTLLAILLLVQPNSTEGESALRPIVISPTAAAGNRPPTTPGATNQTPQAVEACRRPPCRRRRRCSWSGGRHPRSYRHSRA